MGTTLTSIPLHLLLSEELMNKMEAKLSNWIFFTLNLVSRLNVVKPMLQVVIYNILLSLATPKGILSKLRNLQYSFFWRRAHQNRKWALVAWEKL